MKETRGSADPTWRWLPWALVLAFGVLATFYSATTPIFEAPDALWHYGVVESLAHGHFATPNAATRQEATQPPLYYALGAVIWRLAPAPPLSSVLTLNPYFDYRPTATSNRNVVYHGAAWEQFPYAGLSRTVHLVRLVSVALGMLTVAGTYALARALWPRHRRRALAAAAFVGLDPQFLFLSGVITNDVAIFATATWTMVFLVVWLRRAPEGDAAAGPAEWPQLSSRGVLAALSLALGLALLSKATAFGLGLIVGLALLRWGRPGERWRVRLERAAAVLAGAAAVGGWWYLRLWLLYRDPLGTGVRQVALGRTQPYTLTAAVADLGQLATSSVARFGSDNLAPPSWILAAYLLVAVSGLAVGLALALRRPEPALAGQLAWIGLILLLFYVWQLISPGPQGRLIFPSLASLAVIWALGADAGLARLPRCWRRSASLGLGGAAVVGAVGLPLLVIAPAFRPAPTELLAALPATARPAAVPFGSAVTLVGYDRLPTDVRPGETVPLHLYWRRGAEPTAALSFDVHAIDAHGQAVAGADTSLAPGLAADQWPTDRVVRIALSLRLPRDAATPQVVRLDLGVYTDHAGALHHLATGTGGQSLALGDLRLAPSAPSVAPPIVRLASPSGPAIGLLGWSVDPVAPVPGAALRVTLQWRADQPLTRDYTAFVHLGRGGKLVAQHDGPPLDGAFPTTAWRPGDAVTDVVVVPLPAGLAPGPVDLTVGWYNLATGTRLTYPGGDSWTLTTLTVQAPR